MKRRKFLQKLIIGATAVVRANPLWEIMGSVAPPIPTPGIIYDAMRYTAFLVGNKPPLMEEYILPALYPLAETIDNEILKEIKTCLYQK